MMSAKEEEGRRTRSMRRRWGMSSMMTGNDEKFQRRGDRGGAGVAVD
jgi:hypothetical protein